MSGLLDIIIIGAGWSGVVAARDLATKGHRVLVLEARERIGGRAKTLTSFHGMHAPVDVGCSWIHGYKEGNPARQIASGVGVATHLSSSTESEVYGPDGPLSHAVASKLLLNLSSARAAAKSYAQTTVPAPDASASLSTFILAPTSPLFVSIDASLAMGIARSMEVSLGAPLEKVSLRWAGWEDAFAGSNAAPEAGFQAFVETVFDTARRFGAEERLGELVHSLKRREDGNVTVRTDKGAYNARTVICTIPLSVLKNNPPKFDPALPSRRREIMEGTHVGVLEKLVLVYPDAWWPRSSSVGSFTFLPTEPTVSNLDDSMEIKAIFASHTLSVTSFAAPILPDPHPTLLFYLSSTPARLLAQFPTQEVTRAAHAFLIDRFKPTSSPPEPTEASTMTNWMNDPFSMGATTTSSVINEGRSPLDFMELGKPLWEGRLGFAGEHTDANHRGSVAGAIVSGQREALRVDRLLTLLSEL